jgi:hypothetical protein
VPCRGAQERRSWISEFLHKYRSQASWRRVLTCANQRHGT